MLDEELQDWINQLPEKFQFTEHSIQTQLHEATAASLATYTIMHAMWCSVPMLLDRGSLAYDDVRIAEMPEVQHKRIDFSVTCKEAVDVAIRGLLLLKNA